MSIQLDTMRNIKTSENQKIYNEASNNSQWISTKLILNTTPSVPQKEPHLPTEQMFHKRVLFL